MAQTINQQLHHYPFILEITIKQKKHVHGYDIMFRFKVITESPDMQSMRSNYISIETSAFVYCDVKRSTSFSRLSNQKLGSRSNSERRGKLHSPKQCITKVRPLVTFLQVFIVSWNNKMTL